MTQRVFYGFNNLRLVADCYGAPDADKVVLFAHGGGQTRHSWKSTASILADHTGGHSYYCVSLDLRGHGDSDWADDQDYSLEAYAADYVAIVRELGVKPVLVGASLGGLSAIIAGGELDTNLFSAVILVDITPTMDQSGVDKIRGFMGAYLEEGFASLEDAAAAISEYLPHRKKPTDLAGLAKNLRLGEDNRYRWHWDPKFMTGDSRPSGTRDPVRLNKATRAINAPLMLVRGKQSELVTEESVKEFLALVPGAAFVDVSEAGHMVAGDNNHVFSQAVITFLNGLEK